MKNHAKVGNKPGRPAYRTRASFRAVSAVKRYRPIKQVRGKMR